MHQINLSEALFEAVKRHAATAGFENVDQYVAQLLQEELADGENFDHLFTAERVAEIDEAEAELAAGLGLTMEQVEAELDRRREEWLRKRA